MKEIIGGHSGATMASLVINTVEEYGITSKLGFIVSDNASSNDKMMDEIATGMTVLFPSQSCDCSNKDLLYRLILMQILPLFRSGFQS